MSSDDTKAEWFKAGIWLSRDTHRGENEGLNAREIRALAAENARGQTERVIASRCGKAGH